MNTDFEYINETGPVKAWTNGVSFDDNARVQVNNVAGMPFIHSHVAIMPDVHWGMGATIGSVIPTKGAIIPAAVGVDIGCGMCAVQTSLTAALLPDNLYGVRSKIEWAVPHGRTKDGGKGDRGAWTNPPGSVLQAWDTLREEFDLLCEKHPILAKTNNFKHLGTLGTGNHFIEVCLDESDNVWVMLHSGSRVVGNKIGSHFIQLAKKDMERHFIHLPDKDLSYLVEGSEHFDDYVEAVGWAQGFAAKNREVMLAKVLQAMHECLPPFKEKIMAVNCHHNYIAKENHFKSNVWVTRKGALRARAGDLGIIPGSMGARSYIVRGKGNPQSFNSCSHGAGRVLGRKEAERTITMEQHVKDLEGVECKKDKSVLDETPRAYKDIDAVMAAQSDLVEVVHTLKQVICVKG